MVPPQVMGVGSEFLMAQRVLTGIKPTGMPHIGNLLGMYRPALALAEQEEGYFFVASYHALTTMRDPTALRASTLDVAANWLALGLDPSRSVIWAQHDVPEVTELAWILACITSKGMMDKAHAFKDAVGKGREINIGLYTYPILMAADILAFDSHVVPVGKDQKQHVEMARDMAQRFNHLFGDTLVVPQPKIQESVATVPGLDGQKMSKSYDNTIEIFLPPKKLRKKIMGIVTDSKGVEDPKDPDTCNVFGLYKLFASAEQQAELAARYRAGGLGYGHAKQALFEVLNAQLEAPRERYDHLVAHPDEVRAILADGAAKARITARSTLDRVRSAAGF
jgi:tryptophanyl-tRNA synthetase